MVVIQGTKPAQVIVQVVGGNAVKATDPLLEAPVIGVDVLNMNCAFDTLACAQVDGVVSDALILCNRAPSQQIAIGHARWYQRPPVARKTGALCS